MFGKKIVELRRDVEKIHSDIRRIGVPWSLWGPPHLYDPLAAPGKPLTILGRLELIEQTMERLLDHLQLEDAGIPGTPPRRVIRKKRKPTITNHKNTSH